MCVFYLSLPQQANQSSISMNSDNQIEIHIDLQPRREAKREKAAKKRLNRERALAGITVACAILAIVFLLLVPFVSTRAAGLLIFPIGGLAAIGGLAFIGFCITVATDPEPDGLEWTHQ